MPATTHGVVHPPVWRSRARAISTPPEPGRRSVAALARGLPGWLEAVDGGLNTLEGGRGLGGVTRTLALGLALKTKLTGKAKFAPEALAQRRNLGPTTAPH